MSDQFSMRDDCPRFIALYKIYSWYLIQHQSRLHRHLEFGMEWRPMYRTLIKSPFSNVILRNQSEVLLDSWKVYILAKYLTSMMVIFSWEKVNYNFYSISHTWSHKIYIGSVPQSCSRNGKHYDLKYIQKYGTVHWNLFTRIS